MKRVSVSLMVGSLLVSLACSGEKGTVAEQGGTAGAGATDGRGAEGGSSAVAGSGGSAGTAGFEPAGSGGSTPEGGQGSGQGGGASASQSSRSNPERGIWGTPTCDSWMTVADNGSDSARVAGLDYRCGDGAGVWMGAPIVDGVASSGTTTVTFTSGHAAEFSARGCRFELAPGAERCAESGVGGTDGSGGAATAADAGSAGTSAFPACDGAGVTTSPACPAVASCGGDITGTWQLEGECVQDEIAGGLKALLIAQHAFTGVCPTPNAVTLDTAATVTGTVSFLDGTLTRSGSLCVTADVRIPATCRVNCESILTDELETDWTIEGLACDSRDSPCHCTAGLTRGLDGETPYEIRDGQTLVLDPGASERASPYCVDGGKLRFAESLDQGGASVAAVWQLGDRFVEGVCGNGILDGTNEQCDDGNAYDGDGCVACVIAPGYLCPFLDGSCVGVCGDGVVTPPEQCDDGNAYDGDGCGCAWELGTTCTGEPGDYVCSFACGDGALGTAEGCDDGNEDSGDGCSEVCQLEPVCEGDTCLEICGDGLIVGAEACDDGNTLDGDGCSAACGVEAGYDCDETGCSPFCGNGIVSLGEECDHGGENADEYGACGTDCWLFAYCGDGITNGPEACDDGVNESPCGYGCAPGCVLPPACD